MVGKRHYAMVPHKQDLFVFFYLYLLGHRSKEVGVKWAIGSHYWDTKNMLIYLHSPCPPDHFHTLWSNFQILSTLMWNFQNYNHSKIFKKTLSRNLSFIRGGYFLAYVPLSPCFSKGNHSYQRTTLNEILNLLIVDTC